MFMKSKFPAPYVPAPVVRASDAVDRTLARRIARQLGCSAGNRESAILSDPDVRVRRSADYPGCYVVSGTSGLMVYRKSDNKIVG